LMPSCPFILTPGLSRRTVTRAKWWRRSCLDAVLRRVLSHRVNPNDIGIEAQRQRVKAEPACGH
jgi:hypothetical protein